MAAFQICLQVWLAASLLANGLAVAGRVHDFLFILNIPVSKLDAVAMVQLMPKFRPVSVSGVPLSASTHIGWTNNLKQLTSELAILASAFAKRDFDKAAATASQLNLALGLVLSILVAVILHLGSGLLIDDTYVLQILSLGILFVAGTQPINALAFLYDGVNFGASDLFFQPTPWFWTFWSLF